MLRCAPSLDSLAAEQLVHDKHHSNRPTHPPPAQSTVHSHFNPFGCVKEPEAGREINTTSYPSITTNIAAHGTENSPSLYRNRCPIFILFFGGTHCLGATH